MSIKYFVDAKGEFVKKHYIKKFFKKYKSLWELSLRSIIQELERFDEFKKLAILTLAILII